MSNQDGAVESSDHLDGIEDGAGCTEIWERLSERRESSEPVGDD